MLTTTAKISEVVKVDQALTPTSLASTAGTGAYFPMKDYVKALFIFTVAAMAALDTVVAQILQATDRDGTGSKDITNSTATLTGAAGDDASTLTFVSILDGEGFTINGTVFVADDTAPNAALGQFDTGATDTTAATNAVVVINQLLPLLKATSAAGVITIEAREPGTAVIVITATAATVTEATLRAIGIVEIRAEHLDEDNGFTHVALKLTTDATIVVGGDLVRNGATFSPGQFVGASKTDVSA